MAYNSGLAAQLGFAAETTYGTAVTVTRFTPFLDEGIETDPGNMESKGIIAGAGVLRSQQWAPGARRHEGDIGMEVYDRSIGLFLHHAMGSVSTTGTTGAWNHNFTHGDQRGLGLTLQVGRPDRGGTVRPFTFAGCKIQSWEIAVKAEEIATLGLTVVAQTLTTATALASASYTQSIAPMSFVGGSVSLAGSSLCVRSAKISGDSKLTTDRICIGQTYIDEPVQNDLAEYMGELELEFPDLVHWNRFIAGTEGALILTLRNAASTAALTVTANVRTDQATPTVEGRDLLVQTMSFKAVATNSDASALSLNYLCSDTTP